MTPHEAKADLRARLRAAQENISSTVMAVESLDLCARLRFQIQSARRILFYAPLADELDVWPLLEESLATGTVCALPFFDAEKGVYGARQLTNLKTDIINGKFGVREPAASCEEISLTKFDLVLVPGMAFDLQGNRLGRGRGFYDQLLAIAGGIKCGICLDGNLRETIPTEAHDAKVNFIFTPSRGAKRKT